MEQQKVKYQKYEKYSHILRYVGHNNLLLLLLIDLLSSVEKTCLTVHQKA